MLDWKPGFRPTVLNERDLFVVLLFEFHLAVGVLRADLGAPCSPFGDAQLPGMHHRLRARAAPDVTALSATLAFDIEHACRRTVGLGVAEEYLRGLALVFNTDFQRNQGAVLVVTEGHSGILMAAVTGIRARINHRIECLRR